MKQPDTENQIDNQEFDVFLSYNMKDIAEVRPIADELINQGIKAWFDEYKLNYLIPWRSKQKKAIDTSKNIAVFIGENGINAAQNLEIKSRLDKGTIIPVILAKVKRLPELPLYLNELQIVDFRKSNPDPMEQLVWAITGEKPKISKNIDNTGTKPQLRIKKTIYLPDIDWVEIPAGSFIYGEGTDQKTLTLEHYFISRYPITNSQYQAFIDDGGYQDDRWWQNLKMQVFKKPKSNQSNRPRENVSWYHAIAFTRWLSNRLGFAITLPTEQQWEKAARGTDGRNYPWGADFIPRNANVNISSGGNDNLQQTIAVGMYPQGLSPYGAADMAGNVWEWCLNKFNHHEHIDVDKSGDSRVLCGGSWYYDSNFARSTARIMFDPEIHDGNIGFRVVTLSSHPNH